MVKMVFDDEVKVLLLFSFLFDSWEILVMLLSNFFFNGKFIMDNVKDSLFNEDIWRKELSYFISLDVNIVESNCGRKF